MQKETLSGADIAVIKRARINNNTLSIFIVTIFIVALIVGSYTVYRNSLKLHYWEYAFFLLPIVVITSRLREMRNYFTDLKNGYKLVIFSECKKNLKYGEIVSNHLDIKEFGSIHMGGYNHEVYWGVFTEEYEHYELHLAPKSKIILFARKVT